MLLSLCQSQTPPNCTAGMPVEVHPNDFVPFCHHHILNCTVAGQRQHVPHVSIQLWVYIPPRR